MIVKTIRSIQPPPQRFTPDNRLTASARIVALLEQSTSSSSS
jgi:hypothetical protein